MTNQPQIKKYLRKVTAERILKVKDNIKNKPLASVISSSLIQLILQADAEVIEGRLQNVTGDAVPKGKKFFFANANNGYGNQFIGERPERDYYETVEQFYAEWEEIT